ncbi:hypothetical protein ABZ667_42775 [Streptomyces lavendulae]|uniref:hypothetical protein n=1 Tax=Streptomyces lavendulae TaxID=1914 RepID=UPI0033DD5BDC
MVMDVDDVGASMTFATLTIARTTRAVPPRETAPDDPWATASPSRPAAALPAQDTATDIPSGDPPF